MTIINQGMFIMVAFQNSEEDCSEKAISRLANVRSAALELFEIVFYSRYTPFVSFKDLSMIFLKK